LLGLLQQAWFVSPVKAVKFPDFNPQNLKALINGR
jgi:hypothetical protein